MQLSIVLPVIIALTVAAVALAAKRYGWRWTGFAGKSLWDWLQLLVIPLALALVAFGFNYFQSDREQRREDQRAERATAIAADRAREDAMRAYFQQMSDLMLERGLRDPDPTLEVRAIARAYTLTVLRRLDSKRKGLVVQFLAESGLLGSELESWTGVLDANHPPPRVASRMPPARVNLHGADLRNVSLRGVQLNAIDLRGADLRGADFRGVLLVAAELARADLRNTDFQDASMGDGIAIGRTTNFSGACVSGARFERADLRGTNFGVSGSNVDLTAADLRQADLSSAQLPGAKLDRAKMRNVRLPFWASSDEDIFRPDARERPTGCP